MVVFNSTLKGLLNLLKDFLPLVEAGLLGSRDKGDPLHSLSPFPIPHTAQFKVGSEIQAEASIQINVMRRVL